MNELSVSDPKPSWGFERIMGILLVVISGLGICFSVVGIILVFIIGGRMQAGLENAVQLGLDAVDTIKTALLLVGDSLTQAAGSLSSLSSVIDEDLLTVLGTTEQSLQAAEEGVSVLETTLYGLSVISFGALDYSPEVPLTESVATLSENIGDIPDSVAGLSAQLSQMETNLETAQDSTGQMSADLKRLEENLQRTQGKIPRWFFAGKLFAVTLLLLILVSQVGVVYRGVELYSGKHRELEARVAILEKRFQGMQ